MHYSGNKAVHGGVETIEFILYSVWLSKRMEDVTHNNCEIYYVLYGKCNLERVHC